jgi:glutamate-5-semialdehyde dehydrogenase
LIVHSAQLPYLYQVCKPLTENKVTLYADERAFAALYGKYPNSLLEHASSDSFGTEYMDYKMAIRTVDSIEEALNHIQQYGSGHSEAIITNDKLKAQLFEQRVDAACVYVNAPTSFTDGAQFGLGAEIGISTQKLGARGPMALEEITTYKWLIQGNGQIRK